MYKVLMYQYQSPKCRIDGISFNYSQHRYGRNDDRRKERKTFTFTFVCSTTWLPISNSQLIIIVKCSSQFGRVICCVVGERRYGFIWCAIERFYSRRIPQTAERLKLINEDETHIIYVKKKRVVLWYTFIGAKVFSEQFDLKNHFHATNIMPDQIGITNLDDFMKKAGDMVNAMVDYVEQNS
ncbi:hypothetical protein I4U23_005828 [Adineta vaga]|nr:hypothetical protein I4U23_005828 [Adineta vaga]